MLVPSWLRKPPAKPRVRRRPESTFRPRLEILDGRDVPSTLTVTNNLGYGPGSLRYEIDIAQNGDTIVFDKHLQSKTIDVITNNPAASSATEIEINKSIDIQGLGAKSLAISGDYRPRVFRVDAGVNVNISGLTIENGRGVTGAFDPVFDDGLGGAIINYGTLTLTGCTLSGNSVNGGGIGYGAGHKRFESGPPNILRVQVGESSSSRARATALLLEVPNNYLPIFQQ